MSVETGIQTGTPWARRQLVRLKHPYSEAVHQAARIAYNRVVGRMLMLLILGDGSPIPKDTGYLRAQTTLTLRGKGSAAGGAFALTLSWPNVPYAQLLIENAGVWQFAHEADPSAVGDFPVPAMKLIWPMFRDAFSRELTAAGIKHDIT